MDTSTRKFTVRRWFSIYLKNKAARSKNSPGFCQLEVRQSAEHARMCPCAFFIYFGTCVRECVPCCGSVLESAETGSTHTNMQHAEGGWSAATGDFYL